MLGTSPSSQVSSLEREELSSLVRSEQLASLRASLSQAVPINIILSVVAAYAAFHAGKPTASAVWLCGSIFVSVLRLLLVRQPVDALVSAPVHSRRWLVYRDLSVEQHLLTSSILSGTSGCVWALVPFLCDAYTSPQTLLYLTMVCGLCAGSVIYGVAYSPVAISFTTPALLSVAGCLTYAGGFDRYALAAMVFVYQIALIRGARQSEASFRAGSYLRNEAIALAAKLNEANVLSRRHASEMAHRASHDSLTGVLNRDGFLQDAQLHVFARPSESHCLMMLDLDGFKAINDAFGHEVGDCVLRDVASGFGKELDGTQALLARWGGDEFAVFYTPGANGHSPLDLTQRLISSVSTATAHYGGHLGVSIGVVVETDADVSGMVSLADEALYCAKRAGRNRCQFVDAALNSQLATRRDVERDLPAAMESGALQVWFQPIVRCEDGQVVSLEALLRWQHPRHGFVSPEQVIFAASTTGVAESLLQYILDEICRALIELNAASSSLSRLPIAMNVSPRELARLPVDDLVLSTLACHGVNPAFLHIEVTEEVALDTHATRERLLRLSAAGVAVVIDDFGVGYSSLASLRGGYIKQVKIDRSYILDLSQSPENQVLVSSIVQLGRSLRIDVVAEGVESEEDLTMLRSLGCEIAQGYYFARPAVLSQIKSWAMQR